jgi:hypothetical protein
MWRACQVAIYNTLQISGIQDKHKYVILLAPSLVFSFALLEILDLCILWSSCGTQFDLEINLVLCSRSRLLSHIVSTVVLIGFGCILAFLVF